MDVELTRFDAAEESTVWEVSCDGLSFFCETRTEDFRELVLAVLDGYEAERRLR